MMKILSVNVGRPREIFHEGRMIRTGIFKAPTAGRVRVNALNIEGRRAGGSIGSRRHQQSALRLSR
jgi:MOSC domain-containing protein YiiM